MASDNEEPCTRSGEQLRNETGPYILRPLLDEVSLSADGSEATAKINCVEYYDGNLYIGTSASEILHFVHITPDSDDEAGSATYIPASRLSPVSVDSSSSSSSIGGVDLNESDSDGASGNTSGNDATILLSLKSKIQVVRLADRVLEAPVSP
ncbi:hypothetical protein E4U09_006138 [Claviceps aff. purpurea]|uniref:CNH domain-containing protein n=1 Tax=Claviceps aff. purpurea TaxID=1967640 RepID=A0A9P7TYQ9_9HYPO|nr:hypothetical protein E4U09_006138 [Claviceps aff. purpurea]